MNPEDTNPVAVGGPAAGTGAHAPRARYYDAFEFAPDAQFVTCASGVILEANRAAGALLGCPREFVLGKPLALFSPEGARGRFYEAILRSGHDDAAEAFESRLARRGEKPRDVQVVARGSGGAGDVPRVMHWLARDVTEWKRADAARGELQRRLTTVQEDERRRVSRDLHDTVGQTLVALTLGVQGVRTTPDVPPAALARLDQVQRLADELGRQLHDLAMRLRPTALDDLGLEAAARQLVDDWSARTGVAAGYQPSGMARRFPPEVETVLYRVVQEALTNVAKHAGATRVGVMIGRNDGHAVAVVEDDGRGFDPLAVTPAPGGRGRIGLLGMTERVALIGGTLEVESEPGQGTTVYARVPLATDDGPV